jgi:hypothetical protein
MIVVTKPTSPLVAVLFVAVTLNAAFLVANGVFMLVAPTTWYYLVPGVTATGFYNQHFIRDIGIVQLFLGMAFILGLRRPAARFPLWAGATTWLIAHALFHFWEVAVGICTFSAIPRDFPAVTLPALIGIAASWWAQRQQT